MGSKITADGDCSHEIKRPLLLRRKTKTNLDSAVKSRGITLLTEVHLVKALVFQWSCMDVSGTIKKAEHQIIDVFELWCWRRLLSVPWTARRSNQSILKEISPGCSILSIHYLIYSSLASERNLSTKELMLLNCAVGEDSLESLEQQEDQTSQS